MRNDLAIEVLRQILAQTEQRTEKVDTRGVMVTQTPPLARLKVYDPETERITIEEEVRARIQQMLNLAQDDSSIRIALVGVEQHNIRKIDIPERKQIKNIPPPEFPRVGPSITAIIPSNVEINFSITTHNGLTAVTHNSTIKNLINPWSIVLYRRDP